MVSFLNACKSALITRTTATRATPPPPVTGVLPARPHLCRALHLHCPQQVSRIPHILQTGLIEISIPPYVLEVDELWNQTQDHSPPKPELRDHYDKAEKQKDCCWRVRPEPQNRRETAFSRRMRKALGHSSFVSFYSWKKEKGWQASCLQLGVAVSYLEKTQEILLCLEG